MKPTLLVALGIVSVGVWTLALIGLVSVVGALAVEDEPAPAEPRLLSAQQSDVAGTEIGGLLRAPDAVRTEYRSDRFGDVMVSEAEYTSDVEEGTVRDHYRRELERQGWTVVDVELKYGDWAYLATSHGRRLLIEISSRDGTTEVELELTEPVIDRGRTTGR